MTIDKIIAKIADRINACEDDNTCDNSKEVAFLVELLSDIEQLEEEANELQER